MDYEKKILIGLCIALIITSVTFYCLYQDERNTTPEIRALASSGASSALESFKDYRDRGEDSDYWSAVADFNSFKQAYFILVDDTKDEYNYIFCNEVYGSLLLSPEKSKTHIDEIIDAMEQIVADIDHPDAFYEMSVLRYSIKE